MKVLIICAFLVAIIAQIALAAPADEQPVKRDFLGLEGAFNHIMDGLSDTIGDIIRPFNELGRR